MMIEVKKTNCDWSSEDSGDLTKHSYVTMFSCFVLQGLVKFSQLTEMYPFTGSHNISEQSMSTYKTQWTQITSYLLSIFHSFPYIPTIYKIEITQQSVICL